MTDFSLSAAVSLNPTHGGGALTRSRPTCRPRRREANSGSCLQSQDGCEKRYREGCASPLPRRPQRRPHQGRARPTSYNFNRPPRCLVELLLAMMAMFGPPTKRPRPRSSRTTNHRVLSKPGLAAGMPGPPGESRAALHYSHSIVIEDPRALQMVNGPGFVDLGHHPRRIYGCVCVGFRAAVSAACPT